MSEYAKPQERLGQLFLQKRCWAIDELCQAIAYSAISVRRFLKAIGYYSSFTHNSKWYTLHAIPDFDKDGLWFSDDIGFSVHGNLKQTIRHLIDKSPQGLSAPQLTEKLRTPCYAILNQMHKAGLVGRFKGRKSFIYISIDKKKRTRQLKRLQSQIVSKTAAKDLSPQVAVHVLVEFIKNPEVSVAELSKAVAKRQVLATPEMIAQFFEKHHIKKTLN